MTADAKAIALGVKTEGYSCEQIKRDVIATKAGDALHINRKAITKPMPIRPFKETIIMVKQLDQLPGMRSRISDPEVVLCIHVSGDGLFTDGEVVVRNSDGKTVSTVTNAINTKFGICLRHGIGKSGRNAAAKEAFKAGDVAPIMTIGSIWVKVTAPVTDINAKVYM